MSDDDLTLAPETFRAFKALMWGLPAPEELEQAAATLETLFEPIDPDGDFPAPEEVRAFGLGDYRDYTRLLRSLAFDLRRSVERVESAGYEWDFAAQRLGCPTTAGPGTRRSFWVLLTGDSWLRTRTSKRNDKEARAAIRDDLVSRGFPPRQCTDDKLRSNIQAFQRLGLDV